METRYLGSNIVITLADARYETTKGTLTDNDPDTKPTRLSATELFALQNKLTAVLGVTAANAKIVIDTMVTSTIGQVEVILAPNQFAAMFMYIKDTDLVVMLSQKLEVVATQVNLSGQSFLR